MFEEFAKGKPVTKNWPRIPFAEALRKYGSDKPDLRNPLEMQDVSEHFRGSGFKVFARMLEDPKNQVWAIPGPGGGSRAFCDRMNSWAQGEGQPGLGYIMWREGGEGAGPLANNIGPERTAAIRSQLGLKEGDAAFFVAGDPDKFWKFSGLARTKVGEDLNLIDKDRFELAWIVDFPMYEYDETEKKVDFSHNPFSMPQGGLEALQTQDPLTIKAFQYDIACNGYEIASGGIRNHKPEAMVKAFEIAGYGENDVVERFGGMYRAFQYGAPPHGGMAAGVDRIVMLLCGTTNLREISLFPMNQQAVDLLMGAPSDVAIEAAARAAHPAQSAGQGIAHSPVEASIRNCASADGGSVFRSWKSCNAGTFARGVSLTISVCPGLSRKRASACLAATASGLPAAMFSMSVFMSSRKRCRAASRLML